jgi:hypothetical protein
MRLGMSVTLIVPTASKAQAAPRSASLNFFGRM